MKWALTWTQRQKQCRRVRQMTWTSTLKLQAKEELLEVYQILDVQEDNQQDQDKEEDEEFLP